MRRAAALAGTLALAVLAGCAKPAPPPPPPMPGARPAPEDLVALLPNQDGSTGALSVARGADRTVLDRPNASAKISVGRIETGVMTDEEIRRIWADALAAQPPRPVSFLLYFLEGKDELTPESERVMLDMLAEVRRRGTPEIVIIGHTDRVGSVPFNDALSRRRAQKVADDLLRLGIPPAQVQVVGRGEREPLVPTEDEVAEPKNRRVEISVR